MGSIFWFLLDAYGHKQEFIFGPQPRSLLWQHQTLDLWMGNQYGAASSGTLASFTIVCRRQILWPLPLTWDRQFWYQGLHPLVCFLLSSATKLLWIWPLIGGIPYCQYIWMYIFHETSLSSPSIIVRILPQTVVSLSQDRTSQGSNSPPPRCWRKPITDPSPHHQHLQETCPPHQTCISRLMIITFGPPNLPFGVTTVGW
jgi:hypothetical protein